MMWTQILFLAAALAGPPADCSVLTTPTAAGILGGPATLSLEPNVCEWRRKEGAHGSVLRVEIKDLNAPSALQGLFTACQGRQVPLRALGNEAIGCATGKSAWTIIGRVRKQAFVITLSSDDPAVNIQALAARARHAADQVAGNLF